jgi:hypothetical protein
VAADGPRSDRPDEGAKCQATRAVIDSIDWPCELFKNYSENNMGCGPRPASAISWVFEHEERAIILEDDCIPDPTFFPFCEELLERYKDDQRIMQICGTNHVDEHLEIHESYLFSKYSQCWGWATWKRAWDLFDYEMTTWPEYQSRNMLQNIVQSPKEIEYWDNNLANVFAGDQSVWDVRWLFCIWSNHGLCVIPKSNLISNVGFCAGATHTFGDQNPYSERQTKPIALPLLHANTIAPDIRHDELIEKNFYKSDGLYKAVRRMIKKVIPQSVLERYQIHKYGKVLSS